jgi:ethanolamine utilization protein EutQ (cupin superfamily)
MEAIVIEKAKVATEPLEVGPESKLSLVDVIDGSHGAPITAGICEVFRGAPVDFDYDNDCAVCYMLEGEITLAENGETCPFRPGDVVYIPQKAGLVVYWSTESYGKFFYVTYPHRR